MTDDLDRRRDHQIADLIGDTNHSGVWHSKDGVQYTDEDGGPRRYSTDIDAAFAAVEAVHRRGKLLWQMGRHHPAYDWFCVFTPRLNCGNEFFKAEHAETPAEAIARAIVVAFTEAGES